MELWSAVAPEGAEYVAGEALAVNACEYGRVAGDVAHYECKVCVGVVVLGDASVRADVERSPLCGDWDG